ncbi:RNA-binding G protein effector of mating response pathway [Polychaeton citri CBS 116435]|uniref:RNA-binding G protein effector of mating response pathway n=1 Tax=Polychaeton citri CBS 116435 TaxID=1314669 RepID=A0A9P4Q257_9PEZI|nr:RNA-binding G protein effector of mating response pathway [Polychaeton citri CBS 116435]
MSGDTVANGSGSADGLSAAERLMQQHSAQDSHKATVEDEVDEDTLAHPPPASGAESIAVSGNATPAAAPVSARAAGKQPLKEQSGKPAIDTSEESFPALGAPKSQAAAPSMWAKKPVISNGLSNGQSNATSRTATPVSGAATPGSTAASQRGPAQMSLPGRYKEAIQLDPSSLIPRSQLKKPVSDVLRDINKRSKANVEMKSGPGGVHVFEGTGPVDAVRVALKEVASQLCAKKSLQVPIPAAIRGRVVGKGGATIQAISKKTGARINISRQEAAEILEDDDMDSTVDVTIEGDPFAVQMAKNDIESIVNQHTTSVNSRLKHVPAEYYPFLNSHPRLAELQQGRELKMQIPQYHTWRDQAPPQPSSRGQPVPFAPQAGLPIQLAGDRQAVADVRAEIDRYVEELQRQLIIEQVQMERARHQFIVGDLGSSLQEFMAETGCSVILPPDHDDTEDIAIVGPPDRIQEGVEKIMELAANMQMASADVAKAHAKAAQDAQAHARAVTRYLQQKQAIQELEQLHNARIIPDQSGSWQIYAKDGKNAMKARTDAMNLISGHPPSRFSTLDVDPFYHQHLHQQAAGHVRDNHGVRMVVPDELDEGPILLVFEDRVPSPDYQLPKRQPSAQDAQQFQRALQEAQQHILGLISGQPAVIARDIDAPVKFHDKIRRHVDKHHQGKPQSHIPVQVSYGGPKQQQPRRAPAPSLNMRGPEDAVDELMESLLAFIAQEKQDELERGFTLSFDFPQKFANYLIGRKGENINKLREEFDVDIQLQDGKCTIKGPEAKANACKKHILDIGKKLEDEATHHLNIPPQFHRDLIGAQGNQVNRLQDRYNVRIQFPRTKQGEDDAASEAGDAATSKRSVQQPHEVIVKGPSRGADACRDELLSLLQYAKDNSFSAVVSVAQSQLPSLIGSGGREMEALRLETGAQIDVPSAKEAASADGRAEIKIKGGKSAVDQAKKAIEERAKIFDNTVSRNLEVDRKHHRLIIGAQGSNLRNTILAAGGPEDSRSQARMVRFPKTDAEGNTIRVEGQKDTVEKICAAIEDLVRDQDSQTTETIEVKQDKHRLLIGRGGETRKQLEQQFNVTLNVPRQGAGSQVKIAGQPGDVEKAKAHILEITKDVEGETVQVPRKLHHSVADNGQFFRRLRNDHKVTVDHAGQRPPPKPSAPTPSRGGSDAMPLITDEPDAGAGGHSFELHELHASAEDGEIPWILTGPSPEAIQAAKGKLVKALQEAGSQDTLGYLILPDPRAYRHVIGPGGSEINRIRKQTGTKIQVPRTQNEGEAIEITGAKSGVEEARDEILKAVEKNS